MYSSENAKALDRFVSLYIQAQDNLLRVNRCRMLESNEGLELPMKIMRHIKNYCMILRVCFRLRTTYLWVCPPGKEDIFYHAN